MGLKAEYATAAEVPEALKTYYVAGEGGKMVLDAEGLVPKARVDEFRNNNIALQRQIDAVKGIDPAKYADLLKLQTQLNEKELIAKGDVDGLVNSRVTAMKAASDADKARLEGELSTSNKTLSQLMIDNVVKSAAIASGVTPSAVDDVVLRAHQTFVVENGQAVAKSNGQVVYGKDGTTPLQPTEWIANLRKSAPHLFAGFNGGGAGGGNRGAAGNDFSKMTPVQKINAGLEMAGLQTPQSVGLPG